MLRHFLTASAMTAVLATTAFAGPPDTVSLGMVLEPPNLDPTAGAAAAIDEVTYANLFEGLTRIGHDGEVLPWLATSWDILEDGKVYVFHLAEGVTFHDGAAFDASDVVFSLDRARGPDSVNAQKNLFEGIETVEAIDPATVRVTLTSPDGWFPFKMAWGDAAMVDPASAATNATKPVGTGPFKLKEWRQGDRVTLEAYDGYWGEKPALKEASFRFIADPTAAFSAMMSGDLDAFPQYPSPETLPQLGADPRFQLLEGTTEGETILALNNRKAPLDDLRVRKALSHAIDRNAIIEGAMFGQGTPIGTHFAPHHPDYVDLTGQSAYDPALAKQFLAEAGIENLSLRLALPPTPYARRGGEIIAAQLREIGVEAKIINMEWAQWLDSVFSDADFDMTVISHTEPMDIEIYARDDYYFGYAKPEFVAVWDDLTAATDPQTRSALLQQAQQMIADDYVNVYLFQLARSGVAAANLKGLWVNSPTQANDLTGVYWE